MTEGLVRDSHLGFLSPYLKQAGLEVIRCLLIPDDGDLLKVELARSLAECRVLLVTGGLGPTSDDITREVIAAVTGFPLRFSDELWAEIKLHFAGKQPALTNKKQAEIPETFHILENSLGTAAGFYGDYADCLVCVLPGPPRELRPMFKEQVLPLLIRRFGGNTGEAELVGNAFALSESELESGLQRLAASGVHWHTRLEEDRLVFSLRGAHRQTLEALFGGLEGVFGAARIRMGNNGMATRLFSLLKEKKKTVAFAESCTGGLLAKWMTDIPGSSCVFPGSFVVYDNTVKHNLLGVSTDTLASEGAVSRSVVREMVFGVFQRLDCDLAASVSGIAGPGGGTREKPVGTVWIAAGARGREPVARCFHFSGKRERIRRNSAVAACLMLESVLLNRDMP